MSTFTRYPARVVSNDGALTLNRAAVIVYGDGRAVAAVMTGQGGRSGDVEVVAELANATVRKNPNRTATVKAADGTTWTVSRGDGCGCSSPLSRWLTAAQGTPRRAGT